METLSGSLLPEATGSSPFVSWLLCSHVHNHHLQLAINSCLDQSYKNFELIFVANGSKALEVAEVVAGWVGYDSRVRIFATQIRQLSFSLSFGLHHTRGDLIARMDGDDIAHHDRLERQVSFMLAHPEVAVLGTSYRVIDDNGSVVREIKMPESDKSIRHSLLYGNPFCHPSVMFRRQVVLGVGGYLGGLHAEDYDLWARLSLKSDICFANLKQICLGYRISGVGVARRSRWAYASVTASQLRNFLVGGGARWLFAALISAVKLLLRSSSIKNFK